MTSSTIYDKMFDLSAHNNPDEYKKRINYPDKDDLKKGEKFVIEYQLQVYSESNAKLIQELHLIPDSYRSPNIEEGYQDETGINSFNVSLSNPGVTFFLEVPDSEEANFLASIPKILEALPENTGGIALFRSVRVQNVYGCFSEKYERFAAFIVEALPAKDVEEHKQWCNMKSLADYQACFPEVQAHHTSVKMRCPKCGIDSGKLNPRPDWYSIPDFTDSLSARHCWQCSSPNMEGIIVDEL